MLKQIFVILLALMVPLALAAPGDVDDDGVRDGDDNCPDVANPSQANFDRDSLGDACDSDVDGDNVADNAELGHVLDNCLMLANDQADMDGDGLGDVCDDDMDGDGFANDVDVCPAMVDDQSDIDGDGIGDVCDDDMDNDGVLNADDLCPQLATLDHGDLDEDGVGDACDDDIDGDTIANGADLCPRHPDTGLDTDGDGLGDACDADKDGDGHIDVAGVPVEGLLAADDQQVPGISLLAVTLVLAFVGLIHRRK